METIRVLIVEDHLLLAAGLGAILGAVPGMSVAGEAASADQAGERAEEVRPDIAVVSLALRGGAGLDAVRRCRHAGARVLALCDCTAAQLVSAALAAGASGVVCREASPGELVQAVRVVAAGNVCLPAGVTRDLARTRLRRAAAAASGPLSALSAREREVLALTAQGYSSREIGESLRLSHKTVETYRHRLMDKLEIHHRSDLVRAAVRGGLLDAPA